MVVTNISLSKWHYDDDNIYIGLGVYSYFLHVFHDMTISNEIMEYVTQTFKW